MLTPPAALLRGGVGIDAWGPVAWAMLHRSSFVYPIAPSPLDRSHFYDFFHSLAHVIPCPTCREHYQASLLVHMSTPAAATLNGRTPLSQFVVDLHNEVSRRVGKPTWTYDEAARWYNEDSVPMATAADPGGEAAQWHTADYVPLATSAPGGGAAARRASAVRLLLLLLVLLGLVYTASRPRARRQRG
jgi:hypothetical protein